MFELGDPEALRRFTEKFDNISWYGVLGIFGSYVFFGLVVIPSFAYFDIAVKFSVTKTIIAAPYISSLILLAVAYYLFVVFPKEISVIEGVAGVIGVLYQINSMNDGTNMNTMLGIVGSGFMAIHAFHKIREINANKALQSTQKKPD